MTELGLPDGPKKSIAEIVNDPSISDKDKADMTMQHNQLLSEYCHIMREALQEILRACNQSIVKLSQSFVPPPITTLQKRFTYIGLLASNAGGARVAPESARDDNGVPVLNAGETITPPGIPIHTPN